VNEGEVKLMGKNIEELNFLKGELKKINAQIEKLQYGSGVMESQAKLWELREKIEGKIKECEYDEEN
jgi:hypothetical protein